MDETANATAEDLPQHKSLEFAEIGMLSCMVLVGGVLNGVSLARSLLTLWSENSAVPRSPGRYPALAALGERWRRSVRATVRRCGCRRWLGGQQRPSRLLMLKVHLTLANLLVIYVYAVGQICWLSTYRWLGGDGLCRLVMFLYAFCFYATSNLVTAIAVDRLYVVYYANRPLTAKSYTVYGSSIFVCASWSLALLCAFPQLLVWRLYQPFDRWPDWRQCVTIWTVASWERAKLFADSVELDDGALAPVYDLSKTEIQLQERIYDGLHLVLVFWFPATVSVCCYALMLLRFQLDIRRAGGRAYVRHDQRRAAWVHNCSSGPADIRRPSSTAEFIRPALIGSDPQLTSYVWRADRSRLTHTLNKAKRRTMKASVWILLSYIVCWAPYNILSLYKFLHPNYENYVLELMYNLIVLNAVVNPLLYGM